MTRAWVHMPYHLDPLPNVSTLQVPTRPEKGKGTKVTIPTYPEKLPVRPDIVYGHVRDVAYFEKEEKTEGKHKKKVFLVEEEAPPQEP